MSEGQQQPYPGGPQPQQDYPGGQGYGAQVPQQSGAMPMQPYQGAVPPQAAYSGPPPVGMQMKRRNAFGVWLGLPLITLGIYTLVWYYKIHNEMKNFDPRETKINPAGSLLTLMFGGFLCGIPPLVSLYNTGTRIANAQRAAGLPQTCAPALGLVLTLLFGAGTLYYQSELNTIVAHYGNAPAGGPVQLAA